jgi:hypothetical protein
MKIKDLVKESCRKFNEFKHHRDKILDEEIFKIKNHISQYFKYSAS